MTRHTMAKERPNFPPITPTTRLRAYVRRSYPGEEERTFSMAAQRAHIEHWASERGTVIEQFYADPGGKSKADTLARPVLMQAMEDAQRGEYDKLIVWKYDRFSRDINLGAQALFQFEARYGVEIISTVEPVPEGPLGTMMRMLYLFAAENEHASIVARFLGGRVERVRSGSLPGAPFALYGLVHADRGEGRNRGEKKAVYAADYDSIDGDPEHAPARVVQRIYRLALNGLTLRAIALRLTNDRVPTPGQVQHARGAWPAGKSLSHVWRVSTVGRILANPAYRGVYEAWRTTFETVQQRNPKSGEMEDIVRQVRRSPGDENIVRLDNVVLEALVDDKTWFAVQQQLTRNKAESARNAKDPQGALLKHGFAVCGYCGRNMVGKWSSQRGKYLYVCSAASQNHAHDREKCPGGSFTWRAHEVDDLTWAWVVAQFEQPDVMRAKFAKWKEERTAGRGLEVDRRETLETLLEAAREERDNYMELAGKSRDAIMRARYDLLAQRANDQVRGFEADLATVLATLHGAERLEAAVEDLIVRGREALDHLRTADYDSKRAVLFAFDVQVTLWQQTRVSEAGEPDAIEISWVLATGERGGRVWQTLAHRTGVSQSNDRAAQECKADPAP